MSYVGGCGVPPIRVGVGCVYNGSWGDYWGGGMDPFLARLSKSSLP